MATPPRCFLDIAIGDREKHAADLEAYQRAQKFYDQVAGQVVCLLAAATLAASAAAAGLRLWCHTRANDALFSCLQYGWSGGLEALDEDAQEVFQEVGLRALGTYMLCTCHAGTASQAAVHPPARSQALLPMLTSGPFPFLQAYSSDPSWASQGPALVAAPRRAGGRLVIELSAVKEAPKACENFRCLCTGEKGLGKASGKPLHYKGVRLHRVQQGFVAQGGDVVKVGHCQGPPAAAAARRPALLHRGCCGQGSASLPARPATTPWLA